MKPLLLSCPEPHETINPKKLGNTMVFPSPHVLVLGGINGAGKTTSSRALLADALKVVTFVNADVIAQGLCGFDPNSASLEASRIMLERLHQLAEKRENFAFETTLAARTYSGWLKKLQESGCGVHLYYFWLRSADLAIERVANRVQPAAMMCPTRRSDKDIIEACKIFLNFIALFQQLGMFMIIQITIA